MKNIILIISIFLSISLNAQTIFDFESDFPGVWGTNGNPASNATNEDHETFTIVNNPNPFGINTSSKVGKFHRLQTGFWWAYAWFEFPQIYVEATVNQPQYLHFSIYKPVASTVCLQMKTGVSNTTANTGEIKNEKQTTVSGWQELVFKITTTGYFGYIAIKPDFVNATVASRLSGDIDIYIDNIYINSDISVLGDNSVSAFEGNLPETFEGTSTLLNPIEYSGDRFGSFIQTYSSSDVVLINNPLKEGNISDKCGKYVRKKDGPWNSGFYMLPVTDMVIDATNRYFHVMVYKTMESPINLKLGDGSPNANSGDVTVIPASADVNKWADYVFEIPSDKYGIYKKINLFLDFVQTPTPSERFTEDQDIYFDNIEINSNPNIRVLDISTRTNSLDTEPLIEAYKSSDGNIRVVNKTDQSVFVKVFSLIGKQLCILSVPPGESILSVAGLRGIYILNFKTQKIILAI